MTSQVQDTSSTAALAAEHPAPLLELKEITKSFPNRIHILGPISLIVQEGEFVVVIGPSGRRKVHAASHDYRPDGRYFRRGPVPRAAASWE